MKESAHRVLVTGASGFIDSHLRARLVKDGYSVRALDAANCSWDGPPIKSAIHQRPHQGLKTSY